MMTDTLHVVHARAAGLDVHKMQIIVSVRVCALGAGEPQVETRTFGVLGLVLLPQQRQRHSLAAALGVDPRPVRNGALDTGLNWRDGE